MQTRIPCASLAVAAALSACAAHELPGDPELVCRDRIVTVNHAAGYLAAHPEHVDVCAGRDVFIELMPPVAETAARTEPADERQPDWLRGRHRERGRIAISVPADAAYGTYKYNVVIDGVGTLDPRLTVSRR